MGVVRGGHYCRCARVRRGVWSTREEGKDGKAGVLDVVRNALEELWSVKAS